MNWKHLVILISFFIPSVLMASPAGNMEFVRNDGQWAGNFYYKAATANGDIFLEPTAFNIVLGRGDNIDKIRHHKIGTEKSATFYFHRYRMVFVHANKNAAISGSKEQSHYYNYFLGKDPAKWKSGIHPNLAVDYNGIYNHINLHVSTADNRLKYDFIVEPGGNADAIAIQYDGIDDISTDNGKLVLKTSVGDVEELEPYAYQYIDGQRTEVKCKYKVKGNIVTYSFPKGYDKNQTLVIDPTVVFATFSGSGLDNWGYTATYDPSGNFYAGGIVSDVAGGSKFNYTTGAFDTTYNGGSGLSGNKYACDMSIAKFNAAGTNLVYATFLGGTNNDQPHSLIVDASNNLIVCGRTYSNDYPTVAGSYDISHNGGADIVLTKFNAMGTALIASTYIGGSGDDVVNITADEFGHGNLKHNYGDDARSEVLIDNAGNVYVAGCTQSTNFPVTGNAYQSSNAGAQDAVFLKLNPNLTSLTYSTYIGGASDDAAYVLALNSSQSQVFVAGGTMSSGFPNTAGSYISSYGGNIDGYILRFQNSGNYPLQKGTFIGTGGYDQCYGVQVDAQDNVYAMGQTMGGTFPVQPSGVYSVPGSSQFVIKLDNDLSSNIFSTVYGSGVSNATNISPVAFLVDTCQNIYISGWGGDIYTSSGTTPPPGTGTTDKMPISTGTGVNAPAQTSTDGRDFYFIVFQKNLQSLLYATYYGGSSAVPEHVDGGTSRFDKTGIVYQAICGGCSEGKNAVFPVTQGVYSPTNQSPNCNLIALKIAFNLGAVAAKAKASPEGTICLGEAINFTSAGSANATNYEWDFGDGNTSTNATPVYTYTSAGTFKVRLIAINPDACKTRDTQFLTIVVDTNSIHADFTVKQTDSCKPFKAAITNTSVSSTPGSTTYAWDFGDGKTFGGINPGSHEYADTGTYTIKLIMTDPNACKSPDTISKTISFNTLFVECKFEGPPVTCEKTKATFTNRSTNAVSFKWVFGDGQTSDAANPEHIYDTTGTYTVTLYSYNPGTCNGVDSQSTTISVSSTPVANFRYSPIIPVTNDPVLFENLSQRATSYVWDFGDNSFSQLFTPQPKFYNRTGRYLVCLQAQNKTGCSDTICKYVDADVYPLADLPKAFSPNGDGSNDILYVRGAGIAQLDLKIYDRWGEMVFQTTDKSIGWDGKYKGKEAPVEAYAYVMNVTFIDGTTYYKKGNVTLLR